MSGMVAMDYNLSLTERIAGDEAYTKWSDGCFARDGHNWLFFTATGRIRFFNSHSRDEWYLVEELHPTAHVPEVAALLQQEYDRLRCN